jgi:ribosome recycling factor
MKKQLKDKLISEDDEKKSLDEVQKLTDEFIRKLESVALSKEQDILKV